MIQITNEEFLRTLFGDAAPYVHTCGFPDDPSNITDKRRAKCWGGGYFKDSHLIDTNNNYYTISIFHPDAAGVARRRKDLFYYCMIIVADDAREKLPVEQLEKLPPPTYKLETSPGSEQWAWLLEKYETDPNKVDNLLDGLVAKGLSPSGKDPGMRSVTRLVRLPVGRNTKASRVAANGGVAPPCRLLEWNPTRRYSMEQLAAAFSIDLMATRREVRLDGSANVDDHPLLHLPDLIHIKRAKGHGKYDITCPWVDGHTGAQDDGAAVITNADGSFGFCCHHGSCQDRTGRHLMQHIEQSVPGFQEKMRTWQTLRVLAGAGVKPTLSFLEPAPTLSFLGPPVAPALSFLGPAPAEPSYQDMVDHIRRLVPGSNPAIEACYTVLDAIDSVDSGRKMLLHHQIREHMGWSKSDLQKILDERRRLRRESKALENGGNLGFYSEEVYIGQADQFYNCATGIWRRPDAFQNAYAHLDPDARVNALVNGKCLKVDRIDFAPGQPLTWRDEKGVLFCNSWGGLTIPAVPGDASPWFNHFDRLGWTGEQKKHVLQWMAYTMRYPERKINHILLLAGGEGCGKDFIFYPLLQAMNGYGRTMSGEELLDGFNEYLTCCKFLLINESEHGDHRTATAVYNKIKPLACCPPYTLPVNAKNRNRVEIRNIINVAMTSNSALPVKVSQDTRRFFALWTDHTATSTGGAGYWPPLWDWIRGDGWRHCVWYLLNCVDLSDFDPGAVPVATEFLAEMREHSEDPIAAQIKRLIATRQSVCSSDLVSYDDLVIGLRFIGVDRVPTPQWIGRIVKQAGIGRKLRGKIYMDGNQSDVTLLAIRNGDQYANLGPTELGVEYRRQKEEGVKLTLIQGGVA